MRNNEVQEEVRVVVRLAAAGGPAERAAASAAAPGALVSAWPAGTSSRTSEACPALK